MLLRRIATLKLRLVSTHPDGLGGLGFIGLYPNAYATFILAISCVVGAALCYKLLGRNVAAPNASEVAADQGAQDPTKQFDADRKLSICLVQRSALVPVSAAALLPLAAAGMTQLPFKDLLSIVKRFLLL